MNYYVLNDSPAKSIMAEICPKSHLTGFRGSKRVLTCNCRWCKLWRSDKLIELVCFSYLRSPKY